MVAIGDLMLSGSCAVHIESLHGETLIVLSGDDAGKSFICVKETESDVIFQEGELGMDPRARRVIRLRDGFVPAIGSQDRIRTEDGKVWIAVRRPDSGYLTTDFELVEVPYLVKAAKPPFTPRALPPSAPVVPGLQDVQGNPIQDPGGATVDPVT